ncbi:MAG: hypothetical protein NVS1B2_12730 [Vulcanimicrobiaceae bacterium]
MCPATIDHFDGVLWSLAIEVQLYVVFSFLARAISRAPVRSLAALAVVAVGYRSVASRAVGYDDIVMHQVPVVLDLFVGGMAAAYVYRIALARSVRVGAVACGALALAGVGLWCAAVLVSARAIHRDAAMPDAVIFAHDGEALGLFLFVMAMLLGADAMRRPLTVKPLGFLAGSSYNAYLWHKIVADIVRPHVTHAPIVFTVATLGASLALAVAVTDAFERPIVMLGRRGEHRARRRLAESSDRIGQREGRAPVA